MCGVCACGDHHEHEHDHGGLRNQRRVSNEFLTVERDILSKNDRYARANRLRMQQRRVLGLNLISSPGAGKTTLLVNTLELLRSRLSTAVIEGDQETSIDARRIQETGVRAVQINTGRGCHLDAHMVGEAMDELNLEPGSILFIENVGNLVCPSTFDLGEQHKVAILSVTEGDDKPLKYPDTFAAADLMILSKVDLLPYVDFNVDRCIEHVRSVNPSIYVITLSSRSGEGMDVWVDWLTKTAREVGTPAEAMNDA